MGGLTYSDVGMTARSGPIPPGFHTLRLRTSLGPGTYDRAAEALFGWEMHRATPFIRVSADTPSLPDGSTDFVIVAISRPAAWYTKALGPCGRALQHTAARRYAQALRQLARTR